MKTARVWIKDGAFALSFFCPHRGTFGSSSVPSPGNLPSTAKKMLIPGSHPSGGREGWAQLDLTDALMFWKECLHIPRKLQSSKI